MFKGGFQNSIVHKSYIYIYTHIHMYVHVRMTVPERNAKRRSRIIFVSTWSVVLVLVVATQHKRGWYVLPLRIHPVSRLVRACHPATRNPRTGGTHARIPMWSARSTLISYFPYTIWLNYMINYVIEFFINHDLLQS